MNSTEMREVELSNEKIRIYAARQPAMSCNGGGNGSGTSAMNGNLTVCRCPGGHAAC